ERLSLLDRANVPIEVIDISTAAQATESLSAIGVSCHFKVLTHGQAYIHCASPSVEDGAVRAVMGTEVAADADFKTGIGWAAQESNACFSSRPAATLGCGY